MPRMSKLRCNNCGHRFEKEALTEEESEEAYEENRPTYAIHCPECNRTDVRTGWE